MSSYEIFLTQSQNSSAKIALIIDDFKLQEMKRLAGEDQHWFQIEYDTQFTTHQVVAFHDYAFYFRMLKKTVDTMIDTGFMENLMGKYYPKTQSSKDPESGPKVLSMTDLEFGFRIWTRNPDSRSS